MDDIDLVDYVKRLGCSQDGQIDRKSQRKTSVKTFLSTIRMSSPKILKLDKSKVIDVKPKIITKKQIVSTSQICPKNTFSKKVNRNYQLKKRQRKQHNLANIVHLKPDPVLAETQEKQFIKQQYKKIKANDNMRRRFVLNIMERKKQIYSQQKKWNLCSSIRQNRQTLPNILFQIDNYLKQQKSDYLPFDIKLRKSKQFSSIESDPNKITRSSFQRKSSCEINRTYTSLQSKIKYYTQN